MLYIGENIVNDKISKLLEAPCLFCGYKGHGYFQTHTHDKSCPWYDIGGGFEREEALIQFARKRQLKVHNQATHRTARVVPFWKGMFIISNMLN